MGCRHGTGTPLHSLLRGFGWARLGLALVLWRARWNPTEPAWAASRVGSMRTWAAWCATWCFAALLCLASGGEPELVLVTGTHATALHEALVAKSQSPLCQAINQELRNMWTVFSECRVYTRARKRFLAALTLMNPGDRCVLGGTPREYLYTFPHTTKSDAKCDSQTRNMIAQGTYAEFEHRVLVPWFLIRPDLITLDRLTARAGVRLKILTTVGHNIRTSAFAREGCPRIRTVTAKRDIYQQRLHQVMLSDLTHQLGQLRHAQVLINVCSDSTELLQEHGDFLFGGGGTVVPGLNASRFTYRVLNRSSEPLLQCASAQEQVDLKLERDSHVPSMLALDLFQSQKVLRKTVWANATNGARTVVFIAGLEGVGHHMFSVLGRQHTTRPMYTALREYLAVASWKDDSLEQYGPARQGLVDELRRLQNQTVEEDGSTVFFLNTVFADESVNMFSMPWGGPRCYLRRFARVMCNIDLFDLARVVEEAGLDFRIVVLKRSLGASIVSASVNRNFGTIISQTRILSLSWSLLMESLRTIDSAFYGFLDYEDMIQEPSTSAVKLVNLLGLDPASSLAQHFNTTLQESYREYGHKNVNSWKRKLDRDQFEFIADQNGFSHYQRLDFEIL